MYTYTYICHYYGQAVQVQTCLCVGVYMYEYDAIMHIEQGVENNEALAAELFLKAAMQGHPQAEYQIASCYYSGRYATHDHALSRFHYMLKDMHQWLKIKTKMLVLFDM